MSRLLQGFTFPAVFNVDQQAELSVATFKSLGFGIDPVLAKEEFTQQFQELHDSLIVERPVVSVEPFIGIELTELFGIKALKTAFDIKQDIETSYYAQLWDQYTHDELNSRTTLHGAALNPTYAVQGRALAMLDGGDHIDKPKRQTGLYLTDRKVTGLTGQGRLTQEAEIQFSSTHNLTELLVANPADVVVLNAQRRIRGLPLIDCPKFTHMFTRFVQLAMRPVGQYWLLPDAFAHSDDRLTLGGSYDRPHEGGGVRFLIGKLI